MYKYPSRQISVMDFDMPLGMTLDPDNRWVKKARTIPWDAIEHRYAALFKGRTKGCVAKPLRLALGALLIQTERRISDEEVALQIQETPCLQYFCGFSGYTSALPFDSSSMVHFRKRLTPEILGEINDMIISKATKNASPVENKNDNDDDNAPPPNVGELLVDATCAPQNIRYPQDISLLREARENLEAMIDELHDPSDGTKPRTYRKNAKRDYLKIAKSKKRSVKELRKAIAKQLRYVGRDLGIVNRYLDNGRELSPRMREHFATISDMHEQQLYMYRNNTHQVDDRIISLNQPWVRPIVRGKARTKCEFGAKLEISVSDGFTRLERTSFDAYNESESLIGIIERYKARTGSYPVRVLADQIYRTRDNLNFCKKHNIRLLGKPLGRPPKDAAFDKKQIRMDEVDRIEVERKFSLAKGSYGLGLIKTKLRETTMAAINLAIMAMNIAYIAKALRAFLNKIIFYKITIKYEPKMFAFVQ